uniref:Uncharacterized protein n=1 Tax=Alexandrium andersonii TaxID=327968 RepID=A0A7S2FTZ1_9DINO
MQPPPVAPGVVNVAPNLPSTTGAAQKSPLMDLPGQLGSKKAQPYLIPGAAGAVVLLLAICGCILMGRKKKNRDSFEELLSDDSDAGH